MEFFQSFFYKLMQCPDYYPIRYYKKTRRKGIYVEYS
jgi:hypothetical protein